MTIIDHLIRCASAEEAQELEDRYGPSLAYQPRVILQDAVWDLSDPDAPEIVTPEILASGWHVWIALDAADDALRDLPDDACRLIGDRSLCAPEATWRDVLLYHAEDIDEIVLATARIEPVPAGSDYPFRQVG